MQYKLMMCGFSAMCEDMQEVQDRLKVIPVRSEERRVGKECGS